MMNPANNAPFSPAPDRHTTILEDGSRYGPFDQEVEQIYARLHAAILHREKGKIGPLARELNHYWALALARQYREGFQRVNKMVMDAAKAAYLFAEESNPQNALYLWGELWDYLGETGDAIQRMHLNWLAEEGKSRIESRLLPYGTEIILLLWQQGRATYEQLQQHVQYHPGKPPASATLLDEHLRLLQAYGLIDQPDFQIYALSGKGELAAGRIEDQRKNLGHIGIKLEDLKKNSFIENTTRKFHDKLNIPSDRDLSTSSKTEKFNSSPVVGLKKDVLVIEYPQYPSSY